MCFVFAGVMTVGYANAISGPSSAAGSNPTLGNALVVGSQLFTAVQMCVEERFLLGYSVPALVAVGWEGVWGLCGLVGVLVALQQARIGAGGRPVEDTFWAAEQVAAQPAIVALMLANALSIAFFNFFGMSITQTSSASYRTVLDSLRTLAVWVIDLSFGGGKFHPLQLVGFALMLSGTAIYNEAVRLPCFAYPSAADDAAAEEAASDQRGREQALLSPEDLLAAEALEAEAHACDGAIGRLGRTPSGRDMANSLSSSPPPVHVEDFFTPKLSRYTMNHM